MVAKAFFLTSLFPNELTNEIVNSSRGQIANANNAFQWSLFNGLNYYFPSLYLLNFPNVGAFPLKYNKIYMSGCLISNGGKEVGESFSFLNLIYIKHYFKFIKIVKILNDIINENVKNEEIIFFIYDVYPSFLKALSFCKYKYPKKNIKTCLIVPDLHGKTGIKPSLIGDFIIKKDAKIISKAYDEIDAFVFLSKYMIDKIPVGTKPWTVVEGIFDNNREVEKFKKLGSNEIILFYSGAIDERNGILNLLQAFSAINDSNYRLVICGDGPLHSQVVDFSKKDGRIKYLGQIPRNEVLDMQRRATLLINPRLPGQDFTKYSFPSKTMEYFASGIPTLMYCLEGVPEEYFKYCFHLDNSSETLIIDSLKNKIIDICNMDQRDRAELGKSARSFILEKKNPIAQCGLIYNLVTRKEYVNEYIN